MIRQHRILVIGRSGQLAQALAAATWPNLTALRFAGRDDIDLFHPMRLRQQIAAIGPEVIINTAGYSAIDRAEQEPDAAFELNVMAVDILAAAAATLDIPLIHHSSAQIFAGGKADAYRESDRPEPTSIYGQSMLAGELAIQRARGRHVILRSSRFFGLYGDNFLKSMLQLGRDRQNLDLAIDEYGCPTPTQALAVVLPHIAIAMIEGRRFPSILHYAGDVAANWLEIANEVFAAAGVYQPAPLLHPITAQMTDGTSTRPRNLALDCSLARSLGLPRIDWRAALPPLIETLASTHAMPVDQTDATHAAEHAA
ncbi:MAG TPA: sugar nucleotide-binding protein [Dongiaceae bacterium]